MKAIFTDLIYVNPSCPSGIYQPAPQPGEFHVCQYDEGAPSSDFLCKLSFVEESGNSLVEIQSGNGDNCPNYDFEMQYFIKGQEKRKAIAKKVGDNLTNCVVVTDQTAEPTAHVYVHFDNPMLGKEIGRAHV